MKLSQDHHISGELNKELVNFSNINLLNLSPYWQAPVRPANRPSSTCPPLLNSALWRAAVPRIVISIITINQAVVEPVSAKLLAEACRAVKHSCRVAGRAVPIESGGGHYLDVFASWTCEAIAWVLIKAGLTRGVAFLTRFVIDAVELMPAAILVFVWAFYLGRGIHTQTRVVITNITFRALLYALVIVNSIVACSTNYAPIA